MGELEDFMRTELSRQTGSAKIQQHLALARERASEFASFMLRKGIGSTALYLERHTTTRTEGGLFRKPQIHSGYQHTFRGAGWPIPTDPEYPERHLVVLTTAEAYNCRVVTGPHETRPDDIYHDTYAIMSEYEQGEQTYRFAFDSGKLLLVSAMMRIERGGQL